MTMGDWSPRAHEEYMPREQSDSLSEPRTFYVVKGDHLFENVPPWLMPVTVDDLDIEAARKAAFPFMLSPKHCEQILRAALGGTTDGNPDD